MRTRDGGRPADQNASADRYVPHVAGGAALSFRDQTDRGRKDRLMSAPPPSEPCRRISRTRLSSQWFGLLYLEED